jgi:DNA polymerase-3 subunit delta
VIYVLHGEDDFSQKEFLDNLRDEVGVPELLEANTSVLAGGELTLAQLRDVCAVVPFLAERRLVVVKGLLARFDSFRPRRRSRRSSSGQDGLEEWAELAETLGQLPSTTNLVFLEGTIRRDNSLLSNLASVAKVREYRPLAGDILEEWIAKRVSGSGGKIGKQAIRKLVDLVGGNLWVLSRELEKLDIYAGEVTINEGMVEVLVSYSRETNVFRVVDAILGGYSSNAMRLVGLLRESGAEVSYVIAMLARQLRFILVLQELLARKVPRGELRQRLGVAAEFAVRRTEEQARLYTEEQVFRMYRQLLSTDLTIKRGELGDQLALEMLVAQLSGEVKGRTVMSNRTGAH